MDNDQVLETFFFEALLPIIRADIEENKKLKFHHYQALKKALFKPASFFKGFLLPLLEVWFGLDD